MGVGVPQMLRFFEESSRICRLTQSWTWGRNASDVGSGNGLAAVRPQPSLRAVGPGLCPTSWQLGG